MFKLTARALLAASCLGLGLPAWSATFQAHLTDPQGQPLAGAVVTLKGPGSTPAPKGPVNMDQVNQQFTPRVLAVRTGTPVAFPNGDNIRHQVYSFSTPKRFELRLYEGTPTDPVVMEKPGIEVLGCNIHDWMLGYIYVTDDPWYAVSDAQGSVRFEQLPAGQYQVTLWHPRTTDMQNQPAGSLDVAATDVQKNYTVTVEPAPADAPAPPPQSAFGSAFKKAASETSK